MKRTGTVCLFVACLTLAITVRPAFAQTTTINDNDSHIVYSLGIAPDCFGSTSVGNWCYFSGGSQDDNSDETSSNFVRSSGSNFQGASLALTFNGTEIKLYGSKGPNHGKFFYSLDGGAESGNHEFIRQFAVATPNTSGSPELNQRISCAICRGAS